MNQHHSSHGDRLPLRLVRKIDALCDEFEEHCQTNESYQMAPFLARIDEPGRRQLLYELVSVAIDLLRSRHAEFPLRELCDANPDLAAEIKRIGNEYLSTIEHLAPPIPQRKSQMRVHCPHCHVPMELAIDSELARIVCESCNQEFSLVGPDSTTLKENANQTIGHFRLGETLGGGSFGWVYKAFDTELKRDVAIKIPRHPYFDAGEKKAFLREAQSAAQLCHSGIVPVYEVGTDGETIFIVTEYIEGETLRERMTPHRFPVRQAVEMCRQIAEALDHAHSRGVVHRDLKPENIMINSRGEPRLMDFGLASRKSESVTVSVDGRRLGTAAYMSPEQADARSHEADGRSDIYSLGVILFELLTGERPFRGSDHMMMLQAIYDDPPSPRKLESNVPKDLETIVLKCLEKDPARRYESARSLQLELERFLDGRPIEAKPVGKLEIALKFARRNRMAVKATSAILLSLVLGTGAALAFAFKAIDEAARARRAEEKSARSLAQAKEAVDQYFTTVSQSTLFDVQGLQPLRKELLRLALDYYRDFAKAHAQDIGLMDEVAAAHFRVGCILEVLGEVDQAEAEYVNARLAWEAVGTRADSAHAEEVATVLVNLAGIHGLRWKFDESLQLLEEADQRWTALCEHFPARSEILLASAATHDRLATLHVQREDLSSAVDHLLRADLLFDRMREMSSHGVAFEVAVAQHSCIKADACLKGSKLVEAEQHFNVALETLKSLPDEAQQGLSVQTLSALAEQGIADTAVKLGDTARARTHSEASRNILRDLYLRNPDLPSTKEHYVQCLYKGGVLAQSMESWTLAEECLNEALSVLESDETLSHEINTWTFLAGRTLLCLATTNVLKGDASKAEAHYYRAEEIGRKQLPSRLSPTIVRASRVEFACDLVEWQESFHKANQVADACSLLESILLQPDAEFATIAEAEHEAGLLARPAALLSRASEEERAKSVIDHLLQRIESSEALPQHVRLSLIAQFQLSLGRSLGQEQQSELAVQFIDSAAHTIRRLSECLPTNTSTEADFAMCCGDVAFAYLAVDQASDAVALMEWSAPFVEGRIAGYQSERVRAILSTRDSMESVFADALRDGAHYPAAARAYGRLSSIRERLHGAHDRRTARALQNEGLCWAAADNGTEFSRLVHGLLGRFGTSKDPEIAELSAWVSTLKPCPLDSSELDNIGKLCDVAIGAGPPDVERYYTLGMWHFRKGEFAPARAHFQRVADALHGIDGATSRLMAVTCRMHLEGRSNALPTYEEELAVLSQDALADKLTTTRAIELLIVRRECERIWGEQSPDRSGDSKE